MAQIAAQNLKDIIEALRWARNEKQAVEVFGGGSKRAIGRPVKNAHRLCVKSLSGVLFYEPEELVISVRAATPMRDIHAALAAKKQMLAFEPPDWGLLFPHNAQESAQDRGTIGGIIGGNLSGPRRIIAGAARDHILGFHAISGHGMEFQSGGRVVKNVTGYDLGKLAAGSWGTLAVLHEITLKTMPAPAAVHSLFLHGLDDAIAVQVMERALGHNYNVNGAVHIPDAAAAGWPDLDVKGALTVLRVEGSPHMAQAAISDLIKLFEPTAHMTTSDGKAAIRFWKSVCNLELFAHKDKSDEKVLPLWRILSPPSLAAEVTARLAAELEDMIYFMDWGGGLIWLSHGADGVDGAANDESFMESFMQKAGQIRNICVENGAEAILIRASEAAREQIGFFPPLSQPMAALTARIKQAFDPKAILNPGRLYFGI